MQDNLYQPMLQRCRALVHKEAEIAEELRKLDRVKLQIQSEFEGATIYLKTGISNPFVKRELQAIAELRKELEEAVNATDVSANAPTLD